ncbi:MAG: helix-turn-helix domain-containing protein [Deltaproteobacteria bacterium]|nr:helix-turn-helix domain-containing protein [Deltaproteobacteria bacterium]
MIRSHLPDPNTWMTPEEVAAAAGISLATLWRRVRAGQIQPIHARGRAWFTKSAAEALVAKEQFRRSGASR